MKKIFALILALLMVASLGVTAFADDTSPIGDSATETGSITINGAQAGNVYEIYKMLDLESYDVSAGAYAYKVNPAWAGFFVEDNDPDAKNGLDFVSIGNGGYVTWSASESAATYAEFAKLALAYAESTQAEDYTDTRINPVKSSSVDGDFVITTGTDGKSNGKFSGLELGYYLIDSTMGALCGLTTTNPDAFLNAKNSAPTIGKQVKEDSTGNLGTSNTADIGQTVDYLITINVHAGAQNYVLHDTLSAGLTFNNNVTIEHFDSDSTAENKTHPVPAEKYTVKTSDLCEDCTFEIVFSDTFCNELGTNDKIMVSYSATLNENAIIAGDGNTNTASLSFGENHKTESTQTTTKTFGIDIIKTDAQNKLINGATFKIYDAMIGGTEVKVVAVVENGVTTSYRRDMNASEGAIIVVTNGQIRITGLDNGTYYLEEIEAPDGYNKLTERKAFTIDSSNLYADFNAEGIYSVNSGVQIRNQSGTMLPETGSTGTAMFIGFGMFVALATGVLLVTKKRMSMIEE